MGISVALGQAISFVTFWHFTAFGPVFSGPVAGGAMLALAAALRLRRQAVL